MGVTTPDIWGGNRTPEQERYASSIVALNATTGKLAWSYQTVHHDLWDMDMPSQPTLADIEVNGKTVPVIYAPAKTGNISCWIVVTASWWSRRRKNQYRRALPKVITLPKPSPSPI
ncbi:glucose dehydrogenase [Klebsiella pneumoniae]|uniref:Glucose dehydrogenase n=1 Tax=Klebsiella pneumoniae TaxID=573 RepID=A0A377ZL29_KLEPN|nr:glucose dehydrogenase [Klebsiella pneumoniae]